MKLSFRSQVLSLISIVYLSIILTSMTALAREPKAVEPRVDENGIITYDYPGYFYDYSWLSQKKIKKEADLDMVADL